MKIIDGLRTFVEQQINNRQIGRESELVFKDLVIGTGQMKTIVGFARLLGMDFQAGVVVFVRSKCFRTRNLYVKLQTFQKSLREPGVKIEQKFVLLLKERFQGIFIVEIERGVVISGLDGTPMRTLPWGDVVNTNLLHNVHPLVVNGGDDEVQYAVAVHDDGSVAIRLFLIPFFPVNDRVASDDKGEILNRGEVCGRKQVLFQLYWDIISLDL